MRTHYCGFVNETLIGETVTVTGWVHRRRDHGGVIFVDLRDREGLLQIVFNPGDDALFADAERLRSEFVLQATGVVRERPEGMHNPAMPSGKVELVVSAMTLLNAAATPPFHHDEQTNEELRLKYRYLDLRKAHMMSNLRLRHAVTRAMRAYLDDAGFVDVVTRTFRRGTRQHRRLYIHKTGIVEICRC